MIETSKDTSADKHPDSSKRTAQSASSTPNQRKLSTRARGLIAIVCLVLIGVGVWYFFFHKQAANNSLIALSGRIEGDDSAVAPKTSGRLLEIRVREGDSVKAGDTIAVLDDQQVRAREDQARAALSVAQAKA